MMHILTLLKICDYYPVDGVTTNPSILAKSGRQPFEVLKEIRSFIGKRCRTSCAGCSERCGRYG